MDAHIEAVGAAAASLRVDAADIAAAWGGSGRGQVAVCGDDEDTLTLAWQAADAALRVAGTAGEEVAGLWWGTTRPPFASGPSWSFLAAALSLPPAVDGALLTGSEHAGVDALWAAADAVVAGRVGRALVVVSDAPLPGPGTAYERRAGAAAVAFLLGPDGPARIGARRSSSRPVLDRYRGDGETALRDLYDPRLFREQVFLPLLREVTRGVVADAWALPDPDGRLGRLLAKELGVDAAPGEDVRAAIGDAGAATTPLAAATALGAAGTVALVAYGGGRASVTTIDAAGPVPGADRIPAALAGGRRVSYPEALRARGQLTPLAEPIPMGVPPTGAAFVRGNPEMLALLGARCRACGTTSTPPSVHPTCVGCGGDDLEVVPLARTGTVHTFVVNRTMPPPFTAPLPIVVVDLDDGARLMVQAVGDGSDLEIGARVRLVLRRYAVERGAPVYGFRAVVEQAPEAAGEPAPGDAVPEQDRAQEAVGEQAPQQAVGQQTSQERAGATPPATADGTEVS